MKRVYVTAFTDYNPNQPNIKDARDLAINSLFSDAEFEEPNQHHLTYRPKRTCYTLDYELTRITNQYASRAKVILRRMARRAKEFKENNPEPIENYYTTFRIPKASGGTRKITAPIDELKETQSTLLNSLDYANVLEHESAFAYVKERSIKDALEVHQANKSKWFLKIDLKEFFPSFTKEVIIETLNRIHPFHLVSDEVLEHVVEVSLYEGGLPQGSPLSPKLSNLCMIPFDHALVAKLWDYKKQHYVYTRYADDIIISSQYDFKYTHIIKVVEDILKEVGLPHQIKHSKTRYGSSAGSNWNLGLMLNKDNDITIGYRKKQRLKATLHSFFADACEHSYWSIQEYQEFMGQLNYAQQIEPNYWDKRIKIMEEKHNTTLRGIKDYYNTLM